MARRILLITQWFDPEPTLKGLVFARELVKQGFEVEVLTGFPNYPGGYIYPGYRIKILQREVIDGVHITRVPLYPSHDQSAFRRILNYLSFAFSILIYGLFFAKRADVVYAYHPPLTVGIAAGLIRLFRRIPVVYDIQDMWPDTLKATGMIRSRMALKVVSIICTWVYARVTRIVVLSPGFKRLLIERGVAEAKIDVIFNWADEKSLMEPEGTVPDIFPENNRFRILFAGNMGVAQALDAVLDAAELLKSYPDKISFIMLGGGVDVARLKKKCRDMNLDNVLFLPPVRMNQVGALLSAADALLVHLRVDPLFKITIPSKTQAYMVVGKPVIMAVDGDAANLVREADCGFIAESENARSIVNAALKMSRLSNSQLVALGDNAKRYYQKKLSLSAGVERFAKVFNSL